MQMHIAEWKYRVELAACYRLIAHYRMADLIYTHATLRLPDYGSRFLINPYGLLWEEISASSLVTIDLDGNKIGDNPYRVNRAGFVIHSAIHGARHDALCVIHTHTRAGIAVSSLQEGLLPLNQIALGLEPHVAYHDYEGIALDIGERDRIVADLGDKRALILRNHGLLTVGRSVAEAFNLMYYLNLACEIQVSTLSMNRKINLPETSVRSRVAEQADIVSFDEGDLVLEWDAHLRLLDRIDRSYRR
ncbi:Ribulose-5-phosphate 4-epimerase and related epimerases and aldolases [Ochrobactrum soli]|uniref:Ribulose-5-phosphate 4-epimerase and related epimerases and aldolases n=3 Tax=Brucellaceae TaxID=118882 RepID=A0A2P9HBD2_9HYPH|nr:class II aldolase/adducin family protein [Ochrobactrum sp. C6C9]SPL61392.1 Ribulose-5-phosphate 4-epimerase and related epimerases and aldolases [[Ochrobactrum] soli]